MSTVVACTQGRISYNIGIIGSPAITVVACTQGRISYNFDEYRHAVSIVVACTQGRISYNTFAANPDGIGVCGRNF